jgi:uncharacterized membrane protein
MPFILFLLHNFLCWYFGFGTWFYGLALIVLGILIQNFIQKTENGFGRNRIVCIGFVLVELKGKSKDFKNTVTNSFEKVNTDLPQYITISGI